MAPESIVTVTEELAYLCNSHSIPTNENYASLESHNRRDRYKSLCLIIFPIKSHWNTEQGPVPEEY